MVHKGKGSFKDELPSLSARLQQHLSGCSNTAAASGTRFRAKKQVQGRKKSMEHPLMLQADAKAGEFPSLIASVSPTEEDLSKARHSLQTMKKDLMDPRASVAKETKYQRARRQLKAATGKLDRMLHAMCRQRDYAQVEALVSIWEEEFPQFAGQRKHWSVISEHYALALNRQQRFQDVVEKFSYCYTNEEQQATDLSVLTSRLAQSIFVALGHVRDAAGALQLLRTMQHRTIHVTKVSYFHVLNALLHDQTFTDFECVLHICEEIKIKLPGENVPLSLLPMIMMTAAACGASKRAMKFYSHPPDTPMSIFTEFRFDICLQQLSHLGEDKMLMEMYRNLIASRGASRDLKERVSKYLLKQQVASATSDTRCERLSVACKILKIMNQHKIPVSHHSVCPLIRALILKPPSLNCVDDDKNAEKDEDVRFLVQSADDLQIFFSRFSCSLEWNKFTLCEAVIASVHADRADMIDSLCVYALDNCMPIKYAALEQVVAYYYRSGLTNDFERVSAMVRSLRLNKHIPLGIAVTEMGMAANLQLHRYKEVVMLFEDFSSLDGEQRRVLRRQFMLRTALEAYKCLGLADKAMAIQELLRRYYINLLDESGTSEGDEEMMTTGLEEEDAMTSLDDISADNLINDGRSAKIEKQERLTLHRLDRYKSCWHQTG